MIDDFASFINGNSSDNQLSTPLHLTAHSRDPKNYNNDQAPNISQSEVQVSFEEQNPNYKRVNTNSETTTSYFGDHDEGFGANAGLVQDPPNVIKNKTFEYKI